MRVMTYNIHGWRGAGDRPNADLVAAVIADSGADIIGLNEVYHPMPFDGKVALDVLAERLGMTYAFGPALAADAAPLKIPYGNALLSRWPILAFAAHHLPPPAAPAGTAGGERRCLLEARLRQPDGRPITCYITHLDHRSEDARLAQWAAAATWLARDRDRQHLLMGDFNALTQADYPHEELLAVLHEHNRVRGWGAPAFALTAQVVKAGYADACALPGQSPAFSWPADVPDRRIDYIFLPQAWSQAVASCRPWAHPLAATASDHLPVLAEVDWGADAG